MKIINSFIIAVSLQGALTCLNLLYPYRRHKHLYIYCILTEGINIFILIVSLKKEKLTNFSCTKKWVWVFTGWTGYFKVF